MTADGGEALEALRVYCEFQKALGRSFFPKGKPPQAGGEAAAREPGPAGRYGSLEEVRQAVRRCRRCPLSRGRRQAVPGQGPPGARLMLVGEGPGFEEDEQGRPFVGAAGQLLTRMLAAIGLRREEVYISNVVKCRPPENRFPKPEEVQACRTFLEEEIRLVDPRLVMPLGSCAVQTLLDSSKRISEVRGRLMDHQGRKWIATYHPAYLLRNPLAKREAWEDLKTLKRAYEEADR